MKNPKPVLEMLHQMVPATGKCSTNTNTAWDNVPLKLIVGTMVLFISLGALAAWHSWMQELSEVGRTIANWLAIGAMALPLLSWIIQIVSTLYKLIYRFKPNSLANFLNEIEHDSRHVEQLMYFDTETLKSAQTWLKLKCSRIRNRLGMFGGGPEKIAVFSLAGMGWSVWKELSTNVQDKVPAQIMFAGVSSNTIFMFVAAFLTGIALGAVLMNRLLSIYLYQLELLEMVLAEKSTNEQGHPQLIAA